MRKDELLRRVRVPENQREAADRLYDSWMTAQKAGRSVCTLFYDPETIDTLRRLLSVLDEVPWSAEGGCDSAEYQAILFWPPDRTDDNHPLRVVSLRPSRKECGWSHRDVLGSLMGLGLKRERFGDIHVHGWGAQVVCLRETALILESQLDRIGRDTVSVTTEGLEALVPAEPDMDESMVFVSSLRLDALVAAVWNMSRGDAQTLVQGEKVKVNYRIQSSSSASVDAGDRISVRGYGRAVLDEVLGATRKDRLRLRIRKTQA